MYKSASRFRQGLVRKGRKLTSRNLVASDSAPPRVHPASRKQVSLRRRLDEEVKNVTRTVTEGYQRLVKRRKPTDPSS
jgi:hypothetical protein